MIVEAIARLKVSSIVNDGEAMFFSGAMHDFDKLWNRTHDHEAKLCALDLLGTRWRGLSQQLWARGHCLQAGRSTLPSRPVEELDQGEE